MKELSFFLLKNSFGSKMRKGFKNFCNGDNSTSTLNQHHQMDISTLTTSPNYQNNHNSSNDESNPTLEEMILQLDLEEKMMARRASKVDEYHHRMSCVNSSDILRSARNALNQYPRFSLDGKDAMYRSSFRNMGKPISESRRKVLPPTKVNGESVVWCKPGVVGKLMGLDAMPVPSTNTGRTSFSGGKDQRLLIKRQNLRKRSERENGSNIIINNNNNNNINHSDKIMMATQIYSKKGGGYCTMNPPPVALLQLQRDEAGWPIRRFL